MYVEQRAISNESMYVCKCKERSQTKACKNMYLGKERSQTKVCMYVNAKSDLKRKHVKTSDLLIPKDQIYGSLIIIILHNQRVMNLV
jgi:hypothetical protein